MARMTHRQLREAYPTLINYTGWALTVVLVMLTALGHGKDLAPCFVAAAGMILYKSVHEGARGDSASSESESQKGAKGGD